MKRLRKRLLILLSAAVCIATAILWARSYRAWDFTGPYVKEPVLTTDTWAYIEWYALESVNGSLGVSRMVVVTMRDEGKDVLGEAVERRVNRSQVGWAWRPRPAVSTFQWDDAGRPTRERTHDIFGRWPAPSRTWRWGNFAAISFTGGYFDVVSIRGVAVPHWLVIVLTGIPPALWLRHRLIAYHRRRRGRCLACGYDLRGITGGACPECGASIAGTGTAAALEH